MKVYLIRHAQSSENARGMYYRLSQTAFNTFLNETSNAPLTAVGLQQAQDLGAALAGESIGRLYTSPFVRAKTTASVLGKAWNVQPEIMSDLREIMPRTFADSDHEKPLFQHFWQGYLGLALPGATPESWGAVYRRAPGVANRPERTGDDDCSGFPYCLRAVIT